MNRHEEVKIGKLAALTGVSASTIRYYEEIGILPPAQRAANGYRLYDDDDIQRVRFVQRARELNFNLSQIQQVLKLREQNRCPCGYVLGQIDTKLADIETRIANLRDLQVELTQLKQLADNLSDVAPTAAAPVCRILEQP